MKSLVLLVALIPCGTRGVTGGYELEVVSKKREELMNILESHGLMKRGSAVRSKSAATTHCHNVSGFAVINDDTSWNVEEIANFVAAERPGLKSYVRDGHCYSAIPSTPYITMSEQRSGSTWFKEMLNGHPCLFMYGEMFMRPEKRRHFVRMLTYPQNFIEKIPDTKVKTSLFVRTIRCLIWSRFTSSLLFDLLFVRAVATNVSILGRWHESVFLHHRSAHDAEPKKQEPLFSRNGFHEKGRQVH